MVLDDNHLWFSIVFNKPPRNESFTLFMLDGMTVVNQTLTYIRTWLISLSWSACKAEVHIVISVKRSPENVRLFFMGIIIVTWGIPRNDVHYYQFGLFVDKDCLMYLFEPVMRYVNNLFRSVAFVFLMVFRVSLFLGCSFLWRHLWCWSKLFE